VMTQRGPQWSLNSDFSIGKPALTRQPLP